jgi:hypothetical protein
MEELAMSTSFSRSEGESHGHTEGWSSSVTDGSSKSSGRGVSWGHSAGYSDSDYPEPWEDVHYCHCPCTSIHRERVRQESRCFERHLRYLARALPLGDFLILRRRIERALADAFSRALP